MMTDFIPLTTSTAAENSAANLHVAASIPEQTTCTVFPPKRPLRSVHSAPTFVGVQSQYENTAAKFRAAVSLIRTKSAKDVDRSKLESMQ